MMKIQDRLIANGSMISVALSISVSDERNDFTPTHPIKIREEA